MYVLQLQLIYSIIAAYLIDMTWEVDLVSASFHSLSCLLCFCQHWFFFAQQQEKKVRNKAKKPSQTSKQEISKKIVKFSQADSLCTG